MFSATAKAYSCGQIWNPDPSPSPTAGASGDLGYVQPDMGNHHSSDPQTYAYCPPASGTHINNPPNGPIPGRVYGPDDFAQPNGWIHNLEHGARVIVYKCPGPGCDDAGQAQLKALFQQLPNQAGCGTVIARFDEMKWPYAAIVRSTTACTSAAFETSPRAPSTRTPRARIAATAGARIRIIA